MNDPVLAFLENQAGELEGLGHAGIETFRDTPYTSCAREAGQNTLDAGEHKPVRLEFRRLNIPAEEIPGIDKLRETIGQCLKAANAGSSEKEKDFFENAINVVSQDRISILEMSDYNTTGLMGPPNRHGSNFHSLVKSQGTGQKPSDTSAGSFGIGKNASFAVSDLRTVFYSAAYHADGETKTAVQGKAQLVSHKDIEGKERAARGYWGHAENFAAVEDPELVPEWLRRSRKGTSVFSLAFRAPDDWADRMAVPLLSNFFVAIDEGDIVFTVGDKYTIDDASLGKLLHAEAIAAASEETSHSDDIRLAQQLHECKHSDEAIENAFEIEGLGAFSVKILVAEGMPKRIAIIRNGILITQSLEHFGDKFLRFAGARDFIMLVQPADDSASKNLKALENPQHSAFSAGRLDDPEKQKRIRKAMKSLIHKLRSIVKENAAISGGNSVRLDELGEFFADTGTEDSNVPSDEKDPETYVFTPAKRTRPQSPRPISQPAEGGEEGGAGNDSGAGGAGTDGHGGGAGSGNGGRGDRDPVPAVPLRNIRNIGGGKRRVFFTPDKSGSIALTFRATGIFDVSDLRVTRAAGRDNCIAQDGKLVLKVQSGERVSVEVVFEHDYAGPIEVLAVRGAA